VIEIEGIPMVLILDHDLGFVFWLGEIFSEAGCQVVPALNWAQAVSIIEELNLTVDVVVMNPGLPWVQQVLSTLGTQGWRPKIVVIRDEKVKPVGTIHADAILKKPTPSQPISRHETLEQVQEILREIQMIN
jgi:anthranilate/para-aminobenzoate synthase component II